MSKIKIKKISQIEASISKQEQTRNSLERRFNSTRSFDNLKEEQIELIKQNEEDLAIINDDNASINDKEAAEERVTIRNEELERLQTQVSEREDAMPLRERIKEVFKKHCVTETATFLPRASRLGRLSARLPTL